jgi:hypothetical protein
VLVLLVCNGVDVESAGPNGLATGCLAVEAKPEAKGFCCGVDCCTAKPLVGVVPLNVVPKRIQTSEPVVEACHCQISSGSSRANGDALSTSQERWLIESPAECDILFACNIKAFTYSRICKEPGYAESLAQIKH